MQQLDKTCKNGSKLIDLIIATSGIIEYIKGYKVINYNNIKETDHRTYMIDINTKEYFKEEFSVWDNINHVVLNPAK